MEDSLEKKLDFKTKLVNFYNLNKLKVFISLIIVIIATILFLLFKINNQKKNIEISQKFVTAGIYLSSNKLDDAKNIYEEIILSKNKFYSILALNTIIEKDLISNKNKILEYFITLEKTISKNDQEDLIILKKALYLIKVLDEKKGIELLNKLVEKNSTLKTIAEDILK